MGKAIQDELLPILYLCSITLTFNPQVGREDRLE